MELNDLYTEIIMQYSRTKKHRHALPQPDVSMRGVNPSCGDDITLELKMGEESIERVAITGSGCAISEASAAIMAELVEGKSPKEAKRLTELFLHMIRRDITDPAQLEDLEDAQALQNISNMPARVKCATLAWHTLEEALEKMKEAPVPPNGAAGA